MRLKTAAGRARQGMPAPLRPKLPAGRKDAAKMRRNRNAAQPFRLRPPFLADEMLAKLVRFLRVMGVPVAYVKRKSDEQIMAVAKRWGYALLTCDEELSRRCRKRMIPCLYVPQTSPERQVALVAKHFRIRLPPFPSGTLCPKCGGRLLRVKKESLRGRVYPRVLERRRIFWRCSGCHHVYWSGTHYARLRRAYWKVKRHLTAALRKEGR